MSQGPDEAIALAFDAALDAARAGQPTLLLVVGGPGEATAALARLSASMRVERGARRVDVVPPVGAPFDPVARTVEEWRSGVRQVAIGEDDQRIALEWIGTVPVIGDPLAAVIETVKALMRRRRRHSDAGVEVLLQAARRRALIVTIADLHTAGAAGANRLAALINGAKQGTRLLIAGSVERPPQGRARSPIVELAAQLPTDRVRIVEMPEGKGRIGTLRASSPEAVEAIRAAAAIGSAFNGAAVAARLGIDELTVEDRLAQAVRAGVLRVTGTIDLPDGDIATGYVFTDESIRAAVLDTV